MFSSTNKTDHDITDILLKVALNTINQTKPNLYLVNKSCGTSEYSFASVYHVLLLQYKANHLGYLP